MRYAFLVVLGSALWATDALFRQPLSTQLSAFTIVYFEHIFATILSLGYLLISKDRRHILMSPKDFMSAAFIGICGSAVATVLFTMSYQFINPSVAILLQKIQPIFVILLSFLFLGEKLNASFFLWAAIALVAAFYVSFPSGFHLANIRSADFTGCALAVIAALLWAVSTTVGKLVLRKNPASVLSFWRFAFGLLALYAYSNRIEIMRIEIPFVPGQPAVMRSLFFMALVPGFLGVSIYYAGLKKIPASVATILELSFPVCAIAVNAYFLDFHLTNIQLGAAAVLIAAMVGVGRSSKA